MSSKEPKRNRKTRHRSMIKNPLDREEKRLQKQPEIDDELCEKIRLSAKSLVLETPISQRPGSETWFSPLTCKGANLADDLCEVIRMNSKSVTFRSYIKLIVIQEDVLSKLLTNLTASDRSLRLISVYLLSFLVVPSQYELTRIFISNDGLKKLGTIVSEEDNEGLIETVMRIAAAVYTTGTEFHPLVYELLPTVIQRVKYMRNACYLLTTLGYFTELIRMKPDQQSQSLIVDCGLGDSLRELERVIGEGEMRMETVPQMISLQQTIDGLIHQTE